MSFTPVTPANWGFEAAIAKEYFDAWAERLAALGLTDANCVSPVSGDQVQPHAKWLAMAIWIGNNCGSFVQSHELNGTPRASGYYDGQSSIDYWTVNNLLQSAGLSRGVSPYTQYGMRRCLYGWPTDSTKITNAAFYTLGGLNSPQAQPPNSQIPNDIIGPWLWDDLQRLFTRLIWTSVLLTTTAAGNRETSAVWSTVSYADAQNQAITAWGNTPWVDPTQHLVASAQYPRASDQMMITWDYQGNPTSWTIYIRRLRTKLSATIPAISKNCDVDFYIKTRATGEAYGGGSSVFDANGETYAVNNIWKLADTLTGASGTAASKMLGDSDGLPDWSDQPPWDVYDDVSWSSKGYMGWPDSANTAVNPVKVGVLRWNAAGGFQYV